jgi:hypothetical protein
MKTSSGWVDYIGYDSQRRAVTFFAHPTGVRASVIAAVRF